MDKKISRLQLKANIVFKKTAICLALFLSTLQINLFYTHFRDSSKGDYPFFFSLILYAGMQLYCGPTKILSYAKQSEHILS